METFERAYTAKEIRTTLDLGDSTLRKWCLALEKSGYHFSRNEHNRRFFVEEDIVVLRHFQTLVQDNNMPLDNAANVVALRFSKEAFEQRTTSVPAVSDDMNQQLDVKDDEQTNELLKSLLGYMEKQDEFNQELLERLDKQQTYIEEQQAFINERLNERDQKLMETLRSVQELKQQELELAAAAEEKEEEEKKGFFSRLFGK